MHFLHSSGAGRRTKATDGETLNIWVRYYFAHGALRSQQGRDETSTTSWG
jgi:hypothetical protein